MVEIQLLGRGIEFGLFLTEGNPNLTFILFIGLALLAVLGIRFAYYAARNNTRTDMEMQTMIWRQLTYIGFAASLYAVAGLLEIVSSLRIEAKNGLMLATTLLIAFAVRQIHRAANDDEGVSPIERTAQLVFVAAIGIYMFGVTIGGHSAWTAALEGTSALVYVAYGISYFRYQAAQTRLQGTMLDSLLRHLLPVMTFASLVSIVALAIPFGLDRIVVLHVQVVFIIMTATALMTGTIKLRQNLAGL